jgi:predicted permease
VRVLDALRFRTRALFRGRQLRRDAAREMDFHLAMEAQHRREAGVTGAEADRLARVAFGGRARFSEEVGDQLRSRAVDDAMQDLRYALRVFRRTPLFTTAVLLTMALGIGATTVIFSVTDDVVLRALPYPHADRLVSVRTLSEALKNATPSWPANAAHYLAWKRGCGGCAELAAARALPLTLSGAGDPVVLTTLRVSDNLLSMLGARAEAGRIFRVGDDHPGNEHTIVLSDALWRERFGGRADVVGQPIDLDGTPWTVVGVLAPEFRMVRLAPGLLTRLPARVDAYVPLALNEHERTTAGERDYVVIGLLKPGATRQLVRAQLDAIDVAEQTRLEWPGQPATRTVVAPLRNDVVGAAGRPLLLLLGGVAAMLLIMCVNLANMFRARAAARQREAAVRVALGAGQGRLVRQAITETLALALVGGATGIAISYPGVRALIALAPSDLPRLGAIHVDARILVVAVALSLAMGLAFGILPALGFGNTSPRDVLADGDRGATEGRAGGRLRHGLMASQVALSAFLLVGAGLFLKSFERVLHVDKGFTTMNALAMDVTLPPTAYATRDKRNQFYAQALSRLDALPGVVQAGVTSALPLEGEAWVDGLRTIPPAAPEVEANFRMISPNFFSLMGVRLLAGRTLNDGDRGQLRVVLSHNTARALWPDESAIGKRLTVGGQGEGEVIGVAQDVRTTGLENAASLTVYLPYWWMGYAPTVLVRTSGDPAGVAAAVRAALHDVAPSVPVSNVRTMRSVVAAVAAQRRFESALIGLFAFVSLVTASLGIYGVIAYSIARRRADMSIRIALGASPGRVRRLVFGQSFVPVVVGTAAGILGSVLVGRFVAGLLFEVQPTDGPTLAIVALLLAFVGGLACWLPSRRMAAVDPVEALRAG